MSLIDIVVIAASVVGVVLIGALGYPVWRATEGESNDK